MPDLLISNIKKIVSGDVDRGVVENADTIAISNGLIERIGLREEFDESAYCTVVDAQGQTAIPGLLDVHVHNGVEDYSACVQTVGLFEEAMFNGTTTMVSEGEQGPGYPRFFNDKEGIKAQTIFSNRVFKHFRPGNGLKLHAGALVLTDDLSEEDFGELSEKGVWLIAEIGGGGTGNMDRVRELLAWARKYNFFISVHLAPPSIPNSTWVRAQDVITLKPNKVAHANGGTTSSPWDEIKQVIDQTEAYIELIPGGNMPKFVKVLKYMKQRDELGRIVFGSDAPTGACSLVGAMNRAIIYAASLAGIPAEKAIAMATGNSARCYNLPVGQIAVGRCADIVIIDAPPGCEGEDALGAIEMGDLFGCSLVVVDGRIVALRGRDTRATTRSCTVNGVALKPRDIHEFLYDPPRCFPHRP